MLTNSDNWVDVSHNMAQYKDVFDIPTEQDLDNLTKNDIVKISNGFERFFVRVKDVCDNTVFGIVENHLVGKYDYDFSDTVRFEKKNIFMIKKSSVNSNTTKKHKTTKRILKFLGIDPTLQSREAMAVLSILNKNDTS